MCGKNDSGDNKDLVVEHHFTDKTVVIDGAEYSILDLCKGHPALDGLDRGQIFDLAFDVGGEIRARYYDRLIKSLMSELAE